MLAIGLMTGSSMDGIDAALIKSDGLYNIEFIAGSSIDFKENFHLRMRQAEKIMQDSKGKIDTIRNETVALKVVGAETAEATNVDTGESFLQEVTKELTLLHFEVIKELLAKTNYDIEQIDVIGFHGQNLHHNPQQKITIQIGDGQLLANLTGACIINNFRQNDVLHGGQGAPFAPIYHQALAARDHLSSIAIINCGGIANLTYIDGKGVDEVKGYDIGPGNILIDRYLREKTNNKEFMDVDGKYGLKGKIDEVVLKLLYDRSIILDNAINFYTMSAPKSLDASQFFLPPEIFNLKLEDACATLETFTAKIIAEAVRSIDSNLKQVIISGGGSYNPVIFRSLQEYLGADIKLLTADEMGWSIKYMEAELMAYLAIRSFKGLYLSMPNTTGVSQPLTSGDIYRKQV